MFTPMGFRILILFVRCAFGAPKVKIGGTTVIGEHLTTSGVEFYGGIPYAEAPVGRLRFHPPVLKTRLGNRVFNATSYGKPCLQPVPAVPGIDDVSEDCLTVNIHRPSGSKQGDQLPVLFWVYGGGFAVGSAHLYNGSALVERSVERGTPIIYANFNYRLGPFGFPQGPEAYARRALNLGLKDTVAALEWLHANIGAFGGDKQKITIFGESAGAMAISMLYFNEELGGLVRGAIFESGTANSLSVFTALEQGGAWETYVKSVPSCSGLATSDDTFPCLQNASEAEIASSFLQPGAPLYMTGPSIDSGQNSLFPDFPSRLFERGRFARIPYMAGNNLDEGTFFAGDFRNPNATVDDLKRFIRNLPSPPVVELDELDKATAELVELYPPIPALGSPYGTGEELFGLPPLYKRAASLVGDLTFDAPRRQWMEATAKHGLKGYGYLFTQKKTGNPSSGVAHEAEIKFVHGTLSPDASPAARHLSRVIMDYWISFTVNLDPNDSKGAQHPSWPLYTNNSKAIMQLEGGNTTLIEDDYRQNNIAFINSNALTFRH